MSQPQRLEATLEGTLEQFANNAQTKKEGVGAMTTLVRSGIAVGGIARRAHEGVFLPAGRSRARRGAGRALPTELYRNTTDGSMG